MTQGTLRDTANKIRQLADLKADPAASVKDALYGPGALNGILGTSIGESPSDAAARIEEAKKNATDLTGLVRHKKKPTVNETSTPEPTATANGTNGKRKAGHDLENGDNTKKAKVEDVLEEQIRSLD